MNKKQKEKRDTPIIDGDARPDMPVDPGAKKGKEAAGRGKKFENERSSDVNSLEDYKDAEPENDPHSD